jgi:transcriptional regulator with XRE-family HTH domain
VRFRELVAAELERRRQSTPRYSLRRFAGRVGVHHATLSRLLRNGTPIPARTVRAVGLRLGLTIAQVDIIAAREDEAAVLVAVGRAGFRPSSRWLAMMAGMSIDRVNIALQALLRRGCLRMEQRDRWRVLHE